MGSEGKRKGEGEGRGKGRGGDRGGNGEWWQCTYFPQNANAATSSPSGHFKANSLKLSIQSRLRGVGTSKAMR